MYSLTINTEPAEEPVTLAEIKDQLRVTGTDNDTYLTALIKTARRRVEFILGRALITQTWDLYLDRFPSVDSIPVELFRPPLQSVTHIKYYDNNDVEQTWPSAEYAVDTDSRKGRIYPNRNESYPSTRHFHKDVNIRYVAGYGAAADVPQDIKHAIMLIIGHYERNREDSSGFHIFKIPDGVMALLAPYKIYTV